MKKYIILSIMLLATAYAATPCQAQKKPIKIHASSNYITKDLKELGAFDAIELTGSPDVEYRQSTDGRSSVKVYGSDNVLEYLEVKVRGSKLVVHYKNNLQITGKPKTRVIATSPSLERASVTGSGDIYLYGTVKGGTLNLSVTGSGDIDANAVVCKKLDLEVTGSGDIVVNDAAAAEQVKAMVTGSGDITIKGKAPEAHYNVTGSGDISATGLEAYKVKATVSGSGDIDCHVTDTIDATVGGSGTIKYGGGPRVVNTYGKPKNVIRK